MLKFIGKRLLMLIPVLIGITLVVQILLEVTPGDPAKLMLGMNATPERVAALRDELGLNDPFLVRYGRYVWKLCHGDLGKSFMTGRPVFSEMIQRFLSVVFGIPLGIFASTHQHTWKDNLAMFAALFCVSMPAFWFALMLIQRFAVKWRVLPLSGIASWKGWILPCVALALGFTATITRQTRSNMLEVIRQDYITTARAKGVSEVTIKYRHALKNAVTPVIMVVGGMFGMMLGGALISETIFSIPGLGQYTMQALNSRDYPVIQSSVLVLSLLFAIVILLVDIIFALIDPRIRSQYISRKQREPKKDRKEDQEKSAVTQ